ncbi:Arrestin domain-containing protein 3 [Gryganskiella cystojenkinii]|nr:Arrestin domain-containing protein 3 [Gryganskiella cystojenkinii]
MKRLTIVLLDTPASHYLPGDTLGGHVHLNTTSDLKYTCVKIHLVGLVTTKLAKIEEQTYVLNQQLVLLGHANNATEFVLSEGKYSWPFQFTLPMQHLPSSGKYRHSNVKYSLSATIISLGVLGGIQNTQTTQSLQIKDLVNIQMEPHNAPLSLTGSSSIIPGSDKKTDLAKATVQLQRTGFLKGQILHVEIDLSHPYKIRRSPGCFIQLICKENYFAGDYAKEYSETVASRSETLTVDSSVNTGKIISDITIPDTAYPTLTSSKALSVEYSLQILFDMRAKTKFMERKNKKVVTSKLRNKLLSSPGGFQIELPIVVGTLSDSLHTQKPSPFVQVQPMIFTEAQISNSGSGSGSDRTSASINNSRSDTSLAPNEQHHTFNSSFTSVSSSPSPTTPVSSVRLPASSPSRNADSATHAASQGSPDHRPSAPFEPPRYSMAVPLHTATGAHNHGSVASRTSNHNSNYSVDPSSTISSFRSRSATAPSQQNLPASLRIAPHPPQPPHTQLPLLFESLSKPLPKVPTTQLSPTEPRHYGPATATPSSPQQSRHIPGSWSGPPGSPPRLPPRPPPTASASMPNPAATSGSSSNQNHNNNRSSDGYDTYDSNIYPSEKETVPKSPPPSMALPKRITVETPTAPDAINLGLGPASPLEHPQHTSLTPRLNSPLSTNESWTDGQDSAAGDGGSGVEYFPIVQRQHSATASGATVVEHEQDEAGYDYVTSPKAISPTQMHVPGAPSRSSTQDPKTIHYAHAAASTPPPMGSP